MAKIILGGIAAAIAIILALALMQPDSYTVRRNVVIAAPAEKIAPLLADFHQWQAWSPWEKRDPAMRRTFSGAPSGKGAVYAWTGNRDVGAGRMEIVDSALPRQLKIELNFLKPFETRTTSTFSLAPQAGVTLVTWEMHGPMLFASKVFAVFTSMDKLIGNDFEHGLANLKAAAER